jgi:hypothetical protein
MNNIIEKITFKIAAHITGVWRRRDVLLCASRCCQQLHCQNMVKCATNRISTTGTGLAELMWVMVSRPLTHLPHRHVAHSNAFWPQRITITVQQSPCTAKPRWLRRYTWYAAWCVRGSAQLQLSWNWSHARNCSFLRSVTWQTNRLGKII